MLGPLRMLTLAVAVTEGTPGAGVGITMMIPPIAEESSSPPMTGPSDSDEKKLKAK